MATDPATGGGWVQARGGGLVVPGLQAVRMPGLQAAHHRKEHADLFAGGGGELGAGFGDVFDGAVELIGEALEGFDRVIDVCTAAGFDLGKLGLMAGEAGGLDADVGSIAVFGHVDVVP